MIGGTKQTKKGMESPLPYDIFIQTDCDKNSNSYASLRHTF